MLGNSSERERERERALENLTLELFPTESQQQKKRMLRPGLFSFQGKLFIIVFSCKWRGEAVIIERNMRPSRWRLEAELR